LQAGEGEGLGLGTVLYDCGLNPLTIPAEFAEADEEDHGRVGFS
jgi:hypothetical protein